MSNGFLVVGDVHNEVTMMQQAVDFATAADLRLVFVGDLVDYGPEPLATIELANKLADTTDTVFIEGNHDNKVARFLKGNDITISHGMHITVNLLKENKQAGEMFNNVYSKMVSFFRVHNTVMAHGGVHGDFWTGDTESGNVKSTFLYGQVDREAGFIERNGMNYPHRVYGWTDLIPKDHKVIVGHDRSPFEPIPQFDSNINEIVFRTNDLGGEVVFTDTGAGKGGFVSGVILDPLGAVIDTTTFKN